MTAAVLDDLPGTDLLDELDTLHRDQREAETRILLVATEFAQEHGEVTVDAARALLPGRERAVRLGGEGTPKVAEFAPALVAGRLQLSPYAAGRLIADGLDLTFRLPALRARLDRYEIRAGHARLVARMTRELSPEQAAQVDVRVVESADGRLSWSRFEALVEAAIIEADPVAATERERAAAEEQFAKPTRSTEHGMRGFYIRAGLGVVAQLDAAVTLFADVLQALGDPGTLDERRVRAVLLLANPAKAVALMHAYNDLRSGAAPPSGVSRLIPDESTLVPQVQLHVHLAQSSMDNDFSGVARVEGERPLSAPAGCGRHWGRDVGSGSLLCSTWPARSRLTRGRYQTDIGGPCI